MAGRAALRLVSPDLRGVLLVDRLGCAVLLCLLPSGGGCLGTNASTDDQQPTQNWHGPGESDCLIKTEHCDGRNTVLTQCDFCPVL